MHKVFVDRGSAAPAGDYRFGYQPALDGMRAIAVLSVVTFHLRLPPLWGGARGVDMFFVLSGFLITSILLKETRSTGTISFVQFYGRRMLRLLPAYFAVVLAALASYVFLVRVGGTLRGTAGSFFYVANWFAADGLGLGTLGHTWSLSVEEQFYLLWPLTFLIVLRVFKGRLNRVAVGLSGLWVTVWILCLVLVATMHPSFDFVVYATPFRVTELLAGCILAVCAARGYLAPLTDRPQLTASLAVLALAGTLALLCIPAATEASLLMLSWVGITFATCLLIACLQGDAGFVGRALSVKPLVAIGLVSYGIYLWHYPVLVDLDSTIGLDSVMARVLAITVTAVMVVGSYYLIERPALRLKSKVPVRLRPQGVGTFDSHRSVASTGTPTPPAPPTAS